ncbi:MAG: hypothetical protein M3Y48_04180 [Actinomycetota bacterium]|nr:hypothetical protein [Actinomycetota bacterium]
MSTSTTPEPVAGVHASPGAVRIFSILNGLTLLGVLLQALWAGEFVGRHGQHGWVAVHEIGAFVVVVLALATAVAAVALRRASSALAYGGLGLFVLIVVQTGLGEAITKGDANELIAAHIPIAVLIFGLGVYLSGVGARLRRSSGR